MCLAFTRVVVDENVPKELVVMLKRLGFKEVYWILAHKPGISDREVWLLAAGRQSYLVSGVIGFFKQLDEGETLNGPDMLEFSTSGFAKNELQDARVMSMIIEWFFRNEHHSGNEVTSLRIEGTVKTRRRVWQHEKARREGHALTHCKLPAACTRITSGCFARLFHRSRRICARLFIA